MKRTVLYIAMSLDGYIADKYGGVDWLTGDGSDIESSGSYPEFFNSVDTVIMGYNTYNQIITQFSPGKWVYGDKKCYIFTHKRLKSTENIVFTDEPVKQLIDRLKSDDGKDIWICGGSSIINQLLSLGLIDELCISVIPTILGNGIKLFDKQNKELKLTLISTHSYNGITDLRYSIRIDSK